MARPSVRAVFRLITSSKRVGCSTGRSGGLGALEDLVDVASGATTDVADARPVRHQSAGVGELVQHRHGWQAVSRGRLGHLAGRHGQIAEHDDRGHTVLRQGGEHRVELVRSRNTLDVELDPRLDGGGTRLRHEGPVQGIGTVDQEANARDPGDDLAQELQSLCGQL
jgi:hypothetical protein